MVDANRDNNVFRFTHLRPAKSETEEPGPILDASGAGEAGRGPRPKRYAPPEPPAYPSPGPSPAPAPSGPRPPADALVSLKRELERFDVVQDLNLPGAERGAPDAVPFT